MISKKNIYDLFTKETGDKDCYFMICNRVLPSGADDMFPFWIFIVYIFRLIMNFHVFS